MREQLVIRWPQHPDAPFAWVSMNADGRPQGKILEGTLETCAASAGGRRVIVLVPSVDVLLSRARVPTKNRRRLLQALPYVMEEQLSEDIAELHFSLGSQEEDGTYSVAVVAKEKMASWLSALEEVGLRPEVMIPEAMALPYDHSRWSLMVFGDSAVVRTGDSSGFGCDAASVSSLFNMAAEEAGEAAPNAVMLYARPDNASFDLKPDMTTTLTPIEHPLQALLKGLDAGATLNLLQGAYSRRDQMQKLWQPWRAVAAVLVAWVVLQGGFTLFEVRSMKQELSQLDQQIEQTFRKTFPTIKRIVDPKVQMEQQLRALRGQGKQQSALGLLAGVGEVLQGHKQAQINGISYRGGRLDLDLELQDLQLLDRIKQQAADKLQTPVEIVSAAAQKEKVTGRLRIGGGS